jgi:pimeloyl-ACP methyl ester carboxylesterase
MKAPIFYRRLVVDDVDFFYREAGSADRPVVLLLHGFPTSSHMFRDLIPLLAQNYRVIAPDLPGFGNTVSPPRSSFNYTFDHLAQCMTRFTEALRLSRYVIYVFDYGAPTGFRMAVAHPERISAIISQNGNAYLEGFSDRWGTLETYWRDPSVTHREACREALSAESIRTMQYLHGADAARVAPDGYTLDLAYLARPEAEEIQLDLIYDYRNNSPMYSAFQRYFREYRPPTLAVWGKNDPHFLPAGALAYRRDNPAAKVVLLDTGHFALETHAAEIGEEILSFLNPISLLP